MDIETIGVEFLESGEIILFNKLVFEYSKKISRQTKERVYLKIHLKRHKNDGRVHEYVLNMQVIFSGKIFEVQAFDWNLANVLHKAFNKMATEMEHKLHQSNQHNRFRPL